MSNKPFLSIITINYNNAVGLKKTLQSVASQTCPDYEHIIIDGGSTDGSVDVIEEFLADQNYAPHVTYWHSKKDKGVYDAMNKGILYANGKYCLFLNSGDYLADENIIKRLSEYNLTEVLVYSDAILYDCKKEWLEKAPSKITMDFFYSRKGLIHQDILIKTSFIKKNPYSLDYKIKADTDLIMKAFFSNMQFRHIDDVISKYESEVGISAVSKTKRIRDEEWKRLIDKYIPRDFCEAFDNLVQINKKLEMEIGVYETGYKGVLKKIRNLFLFYSNLKKKILGFIKK